MHVLHEKEHVGLDGIADRECECVQPVRQRATETLYLGEVLTEDVVLNDEFTHKVGDVSAPPQQLTLSAYPLAVVIAAQPRRMHLLTPESAQLLDTVVHISTIKLAVRELAEAIKYLLPPLGRGKCSVLRCRDFHVAMILAIFDEMSFQNSWTSLSTCLSSEMPCRTV